MNRSDTRLDKLAARLGTDRQPPATAEECTDAQLYAILARDLGITPAQVEARSDEQLAAIAREKEVRP